ncbi:hypothetical protein K439DRAFT_760832 [Ramaria rubella]|nr:hypothetical protein K439DRAFT_763777 [Ramaria rubella]KAF8575238.1 hypothetical protein K439DRAFT_760832 [Ramaria rubella]
MKSQTRRVLKQPGHRSITSITNADSYYQGRVLGGPSPFQSWLLPQLRVGSSFLSLSHTTEAGQIHTKNCSKPWWRVVSHSTDRDLPEPLVSEVSGLAGI